MTQFRIRPSGLNTLKHCTGYLRLLRDMPEMPKSDAAAEGTLAHEILKRKLNRLFQDDDKHDPSMLQYVDGAVENIRGESQGMPLYVEQEVSLPTIHEECGGTPDVRWYNPELKTFHVWDFKYGFVPVEAQDNWQLLAYGTCCPDDAEFIILHIYQPRAFHKDGPHRSWILSRENFKQEVNRIGARLREALNFQTATCTPGSHCRYCNCFPLCNSVDTAIKSAFELVGKLELTNEHLGIQLQILQLIEPLVKKKKEKLETLIEAQINQGNIVPNVTLKPTRGNLKWDKSESEIKALAQLMGINPHKEVLLTPKQLIDSGVSEEIVKTMASRKSGVKLQVMTSQEVAAWLNKS